MALYSLRLRRALTISSSIFTQTFNKPAVISSIPNNSSSVQRSDFIPYESRRLFRTSTISLSSRYRSFDNRNPGNGDDDAIGPDTILFEGCDYEHWLIVIDFPKDTQLTREEMIDTYVQTAAQVFGSVEEAKKKIYALSTTTYRGFQVLCSEEVSKKFEGLPGVVFVLPDSYVDPVNKEYGGDKYINGEIIERPPPPQFQRQRPPRRGPSNYGPPQQNYGAPRGPPPQQNYGAPQGHPSRQNYGAPQGPASQQNYGAPQGHPPQQYYGAPQGPPSQQNYGAPQGPPPQQNYGASQGPPSQQSYSQPRYPPPQQNYGQQQYTPPPQQNYSPPRTPQQNYGQPQNPPAQGYVAPQDLPSQWNHGPQQTFSPQQSHEVQGAGDHKGPTPLGSSLGGWDNSQGDRQDSRPPYRVNYTQGEQENYFPRRDQRDHAPPEQSGFRGDNQHYAPPQGGNYGEGPIGGQVQGTGPTFGHNNPRQGQDQSYPQMEQRGQGRY